MLVNRTLFSPSTPLIKLMGIKERQERDRETVRRAILDAARDLFVDEGFNNVSIRKIAEKIEYSPAAIYSYFPSKDDIFFALAEEGFELLHGDRDQRKALDALPPLARLRQIFWRLYQYSEEHPQYFALMFVDRSVPRISREYERFASAREIKEHLLAQIDECIKAGALPATVSPMAVLRILHVSLLGVAVLRLSERLGPGEDASQLAQDVLDTTIAGLQAGLPLRFQSHSPCELEDTPELATDTQPTVS
jgi:AcrR family transcriptional regulator